MARGRVVRRSEGSWSIVYDLPPGADGKRKQKRETFRGTKKAAEAMLAQRLHEIERGAYIEPAKMTVAKWLAQWLQEAQPNLGRQTYVRYEQIVRTHLNPAIGPIPLEKLRPAHIQAHYAAALKCGNQRKGQVGQPLSAKSVRHHHVLLHTALERAVRLQILPRNPCDSVERPRPRDPEMLALDEEQVGKLLEVARDTALYLPILLAVTTGMRRGEILGARWRDLDFDAGTLAVRQSLERTKKGEPVSFKAPKTEKSRRVVALLPRVARILRRHKGEQAQQRLLVGPAYQDHDLICAREDGSPVRPDTISVTFPRLVKKAGLPPIRFHDLRHTHATMMLRQGEHPKVVSERLGHSSIAITIDKYSHVLKGMQGEAAARLDERLGAALGDG